MIEKRMSKRKEQIFGWCVLAFSIWIVWWINGCAYNEHYQKYHKKQADHEYCVKQNSSQTYKECMNMLGH